eukprot:TRINITY_DN6701_c0_g1_i1.p1 TRINITY_DN6701_c0_g1~~TRINITY_DN6701_c0_g1_i1.p1  ORF type:complete len:135 (-),score=24.71 TRINITY_DN6701_c0_g1_i1:62-466(-)
MFFKKPKKKDEKIEDETKLIPISPDELNSRFTRALELMNIADNVKKDMIDTFTPEKKWDFVCQLSLMNQLKVPGIDDQIAALKVLKDLTVSAIRTVAICIKTESVYWLKSFIDHDGPRLLTTILSKLAQKKNRV